MDQPERLAHLEARLSRVESELQNLIRAIDIVRSESPGSFVRAGKPAADASHVPRAEASPRPSFDPPSALDRTSAERGLEAWFGENALLLVGVLALIAAVGFALKHAFDQGWVSPGLRVLGGLVFGLGLAVYGEHEHRRGLQRFGAAAVGAGAAIAYLAIWAAAGPYDFMGSVSGIAALAALSGLVFLSAWRSNEAWLAAIAAIGAYIAPFTLGDASTSADLLLGYSFLITGAVALAAARRRWQVTMGLVVTGFFTVAIVAHERADLVLFAIYLAVGGGVGVVAFRRLGWLAHELATWGAAWLGLLAGGADVDGTWTAWTYAVTPMLLVAPGWLASIGRGEDGGRPLLRRAMLGASAIAWTLVILVALAASIDNPVVPATVVMLVYLAPAIRLRIPELLAAALAVAALGVTAQWEGSDLTLGWAILIIGAGFFSRREPLSASRWTAVVLGFFSVQRLLAIDQVNRAASDPAFLGAWSLTFYALVAAFVYLAVYGWNEDNRRIADWPKLDLQVITWLLAGALILIGGTIEIDRFFHDLIRRDADLAVLASGLSVSTFWLVYAGVVLAFGFRTDRQAVRVTGLAVAGLAIAKVAFWDLGRLEALYRVGSFALLAVIALVGAHAYHRRAKTESTG